MEFDDAWAITKTFLKTKFSEEDRHIKRLEMFGRSK
jgi:ribose 5-phosphate isomerase RpiB